MKCWKTVLIVTFRRMSTRLRSSGKLENRSESSVCLHKWSGGKEGRIGFNWAKNLSLKYFACERRLMSANKKRMNVWDSYYGTHTMRLNGDPYEGLWFGERFRLLEARSRINWGSKEAQPFSSLRHDRFAARKRRIKNQKINSPQRFVWTNPSTESHSKFLGEEASY